jgi:hypothetical protein
MLDGRGNHLKFLWPLVTLSSEQVLVDVLVTDRETKKCVDPGKNGAILDAGGGGGPGPPGGGGNGQSASDSEEVTVDVSRCWKARETGSA